MSLCYPFFVLGLSVDISVHLKDIKMGVSQFDRLSFLPNDGHFILHIFPKTKKWWPFSDHQTKCPKTFENHAHIYEHVHDSHDMPSDLFLFQLAA